MAMMLNLSKRIMLTDHAMRSGGTYNRRDFMGDDVLGRTIGIIGLGLGGAFGALASSEWSKAQKECATSASCTANENSLANGDRTNALTLATVSTIGFIAGGALLAGGVVLYLVAPRASSSTGLVVAPGSEGSVAGLTLRGGW